MSESDPTKAELADQLVAAQRENGQLKAKLAAAGRPAGNGPAYVFQLSEGDRQELELHGVISGPGGRLMTKADVVEAMANAGQEGVEIADAPDATRIDPATLAARTGPGVEGVDFIYPSVERGKIDPAVAGTPGISGPAATSTEA